MSAWIESHQTLRDHPRKDALAEALYAGTVPDDVADCAAIGVLHKLWWWALDYAQDGDLSPFTDRQIAKGCRWVGDPHVLVDGLITSGFLNSDRSIHDWHDYAGRLLERRERDRQRKAASRAADSPRDVQRTSSGQDMERRSLARAHTEPNQTIENQEHTLTADAASMPLEVAEDPAEGFADFWKAYPRKVGRASAERRWHKLSKSDRLAAIAAAEHVAAYVKDQAVDLQYVPQGDTFLGPQRKWQDWAQGRPPGYDGTASGAAPKKPTCKRCARERFSETELTWCDGVLHCPICGWEDGEEV